MLAEVTGSLCLSDWCLVGNGRAAIPKEPVQGGGRKLRGPDSSSRPSPVPSPQQTRERYGCVSCLTPHRLPRNCLAPPWSEHSASLWGALFLSCAPSRGGRVTRASAAAGPFPAFLETRHCSEERKGQPRLGRSVPVETPKEDSLGRKVTESRCQPVLVGPSMCLLPLPCPSLILQSFSKPQLCPLHVPHSPGPGRRYESARLRLADLWVTEGPQS